MNISIINTTNLIVLLTKLLLDLVVMFIIFRLIYFRLRRNRSYLFMFGIFNTIIFLVCSLLNHLMLSLGFSFGIFAIFSILRYRTISIPIKEMTYLFIAISIAMINALANNENISIVELLVINMSIIVVTFVLEKAWMKNEAMKYLVYEKIELVKPENSELLLADLKERTGLDIYKVEIGKIDFLKDVADLRIFFHANNINNFVTVYNYITENSWDDDD